MRRALQPNRQCDLNQVNIAQFESSKELYKIFSKAYGVKKSQIELFNGCDHAIETFFIHIVHKKIAKCYIYAPCFSYFEQLAKLFCQQVTLINRLDDLDVPIAQDALVIFTNPSKPDGLYYNLEPLFAKWQEKNATIFIDEAFLEFTNYSSISKRCNEYKQLYVLKSMQRFFNTQGLRVSTLISHANNIKVLRDALPKYRLSALDTHYLKDIMQDGSFKPIHQAVTIKNMQLLEEVLKCSGMVEKIYETHTNMMLCQLKQMDAKTFVKLFSKAQLDIKSCEHFAFLDEYHVRFTIYSEEDIRSLVETFKEVYKDKQ